MTVEDLRKAVETLNKLGNDFRIIASSENGGKRLICSVSTELD